MGAATGARGGDVVAFGHTHLPWHRVVGGIHFVNMGSVGRPKDGDWRAGYALLDMSAECVDVVFRRVEYDVERAVGAIMASGLPTGFADHLRSGAVTTVAGRVNPTKVGKRLR